MTGRHSCIYLYLLLQSLEEMCRFQNVRPPFAHVCPEASDRRLNGGETPRLGNEATVA